MAKVIKYVSFFKWIKWAENRQTSDIREGDKSLRDWWMEGDTIVIVPKVNGSHGGNVVRIPPHFIQYIEYHDDEVASKIFMDDQLKIKLKEAEAAEMNAAIQEVDNTLESQHGVKARSG